MLDKEFQYYKDHQKELAEKYHGKFLVIRGEEIIGVYNTELEAYTAAKTSYKPGTFLIQQSLKQDEETTQVFHSRIAI